MRKFIPLACVILFLSVAQAAAEVRLDGTFEAREACEAYQSIRNETNPGSIRTEAGKSYPLVAKNKPDATYYLIEIEGAQPQRRWVEIRCGDLEAASDGSNGGGDRLEFLLVASWEPAFCESSAGNGKGECETQTPGRFDATHFSLHGLWPQPKGKVYCRVPPALRADDGRHAWDRLPEPVLTDATRQELDRVMPGTVSNLQRHEWIKHGTCFGGELPEAYFARAIALMNQLNDSVVQKVVADHIGSEVTADAIRQAFDASFGAGAGERVLVSCKNDGGRRLISELWINLAGAIGDRPSLGPLITAAKPREMGCPSGTVDPVGGQ